MDKIIGYCGLNCHKCAIYLATREQDEEKRYKMRADIAEQIKKHYGQKCKPEDVTDCDGCRSEDDKLFAGSRNCQVRKCGRQKSVENCAHCNEYPCEELEKLSAKEPEVKKRLEEIRNKL